MLNNKPKELNDLIAFYSFKGNSHDESGNNNHGRVYGAELTTDRFGNKNSAYRFDGIDDHIEIKRALVSGDFTISFWLKSDGVQNRFAVPISQGNMAYRGFSFTFTKGHYNGFCWGTSDENKISDVHWGKSVWRTLNFHFPKDINSDLSWHHLAVKQEGSNIAAFRDGMLEEKISGSPIRFGDFNFSIGQASANTDFNHRAFKGVIDDIRIYNRALSDEEIRNLFKLNN